MLHSTHNIRKGVYISVYICFVSVCVYSHFTYIIWKGVCVYIYIYIGLGVLLYTQRLERCIYIHMCIYVLCLCVHVQSLYIQLWKGVCVYIYIYIYRPGCFTLHTTSGKVCIYIYICMLCVCVCTVTLHTTSGKVYYTYICVCMLRVCICTCIHKYIKRNDEGVLLGYV
jgi:hypothetical protein